MQAQKLKTWTNTLHAAMNPDMVRVMIGKALRRLRRGKGQLTPQENKLWLKSQAQDLGDLLKKFDSDLQEETRAFAARFKKHANEILSAIPYDLGGGGGVPLLYILVRKFLPAVVVETGVAAGFSSGTILTALDKNGAGHLFSSDFPYFRLPNPERFVGVVVEPGLKSRWSLHLKGDEVNLPQIMANLPAKINLFHYDSDKSYDGRDFAMKAVRPHLAENAIVIMDDIQDNSYFHDYVTANPDVTWSVYYYEGKYIGLIGRVL